MTVADVKITPAPAPPARNSLFILAARLVELAASVAIAAVVARYLGVAGYGHYALIIAFVMLFGQFISFGLEHIIIREVAREPSRLRELLGAGMTLEVMLGAAVVPLLAAFSLLADLGKGAGAGVLVFGAAFFLRAFYEVVYRSTFVGCGAARYETVLTLVFQGLRLGFVGAVVLAGGGVVAVLGAVLAAEAVNAVAAYAVLRWKFTPARPQWRWPVMKYLLIQAGPIAAVGILNNIYLQQDTLLIKWLADDSRAVGYFAAAYRLVTFFIFLTVPMLWPLLPEFSRRAGAGTADLVAGARRAARAALFVILPAAVLSAWFAPELIRFIFGRDYLAAAPALTVLAASMAARPLWYVADAALIASGRQRYLAAVALIAVLVNLGLDVWLIPRMGFMGAAWGTVAADVTGVVAGVVVASVVLGRPLVDTRALAPAALAAAVGLALWATAAWPRWATGPAAVLAFAAGTLLLLGKEDRAALGAAAGLRFR